MGRPVCPVRDAAVSDLELEEQIADIRGEDDVFEETSASTFESDLRAGLGALWLSGEFGDVQLQPSSGAPVVAHRAVLASRSAHFKTLLEAARASFDGAAVGGAIVGVDAERDALVGVLGFLYADELPADADAPALLQLREQAQAWGLAALVLRCTAALARSLTVESVCEVLRACGREEARARLDGATIAPSTDRLKRACGAYAAARFADVSTTDGFGALPPPQQVWLFAQRCAHPLHAFAAGQSFMPPADLLHALLAPPFAAAVDGRAPRGPDGGAFAGSTPLQVALSRHNWALCALVLDAGASLWPPGAAHGRSLLHAAAAAGDAQACAFLVQRGASLSAKDDDGHAPLDLAVLGEHEEAATALKERGAASVKEEGGQALVHTLAAEGKAKQLGLLLEPSAADAPNGSGYTALHLATLHNQRDAVELLIQNKADVNRMPSGGGPSPLHLAAKQAAGGILSLLLENGALLHAKMAPTGETPLHLACYAQEPECCELLIAAAASLDERDASGFVPLHLAAEHSLEPLLACRALLAAGARANVTDYVSKQTPLHRLCDRGGGERAAEALGVFLQHGATVNLQDKHGHTPLHIATFRSHADLAVALVAGGASPNVPSAEGLCALSARPPSAATLRGGKAPAARLKQRLIASIGQPPPWLPDQLAPECQLCAVPFSASNRRHHCRHCGRISCGACSAHKLPIPKFGVSKPTRVCADCFPVLEAAADGKDIAGVGAKALPAFSLPTPGSRNSYGADTPPDEAAPPATPPPAAAPWASPSPPSSAAPSPFANPFGR